MYQTVYYDRSEKQYYLKDDVEGWSVFQYRPTYYRLDPYGEHFTLFGDKCSPFKGKFDWSDPNILEKDIDKELLILRDLYYETDDMPSSHNVVYLDIEIEMLGALTPQTIREANAEITAVALIDVTSKRKFCFILDKKKEIISFKEDTKEIISCSSENELLTKFLKTWQELDPTICVHYNGDFFDIPYLYYRIKKTLGENKALRLSPIEKVTENLYSADSPVRIGGINCLDFMHLLKKYIAKEEPSYKLGDIGTKYVKLGKIEYQGSLDKLFKEDKNKFIEYNLRDVEIIEALEEKLKFIQLTVLISHLCHTPYESIYYNTVLNEGAILTYLKRKGVIAPNKPTTTNPSIKEFNIGDAVVNQRGTPTIDGIIHYLNKDQIQVKTLQGAIITRSANTLKKKDSYAGGYLLDPVPGLYSNLSDLDFTSLYPSIIKSLNLGVETLIGRITTEDNYEQNFSLEKLKLKNPEEEVQIERLNKTNYQLKSTKIKLGQLINLIEDNDWSISASGAFYTNEIKSIACEVLEDWFDKREHYRALKKKAGKAEDWENYKLYDLYQMAFKILQNALYGTYAINGWRFTDGYKICSASITNSGQRLTQESIIFVNAFIDTIIHNKNEDNQYVRASDTDSLYIELTDLLLHKYPNIDLSDKKNKILKLLELTSELQIKANENLNKICTDLFNISGKHYFELKQEVIVEKAYWAGKRRYAMYVVNKEGIDVEELDMKGLDLMKSNFPPLFRDFGKTLIEKVIFGEDKKDIDKFIIEFRESLTTINWKKLLKPTGLKKVGEYIENPPLSGEIFSKLKKKCPINTKSAIYYNDLLRFKKLDKKYPTFQIGDKMFIAYLKTNPYRIDVIGFNGYSDPPEVIDFIERFIDRALVFDSVMKNKLESLYQDINWEMPIFNKNVAKFFSFI